MVQGTLEQRVEGRAGWAVRTREAELDRDGRGQRRSPTRGTGPGAPAWAEPGENGAVAPEVERQRRQGRVSQGPCGDARQAPVSASASTPRPPPSSRGLA